MKELSIPLLTEQDIDCRVQSVSKAKTGRVGAVLLLYKDARVDMRILDQVFGPGNWQRTHEVINGNLFCNIDIWDDEKKTWVRKQDVGTESNTEKEKGQASDSFKRAGFNVGIGRELYTGPFIYVELADGEFYPERQGQKEVFKCYASSSPLSPRTPSASTAWTASCSTTTATSTSATSATGWCTKSPSTPTAR